MMSSKQKRIIVHVDMDAFFTSIEQLDNIEYRGKPVVVGADPKNGRGRGVVSASSYEARKYGIYSAMPISQAFRKCRHAVFLKPRMERYSEVSDRVMEILESFSPLVEQISIDEAFLDCTGTQRIFGLPDELGNKIKKTINDKTGLYASIGIASNKSIAKIASDLDKPDGLIICENGREREFLSPLPVEKLWGAGKKTVKILQSLGFKTIVDLTSASRDNLHNILGEWGSHLWDLANGIDERPVITERIRKSISEEITFNEDVSNDEPVLQAILSIADRLSRRMRKHGISGKTITVKIRLEGFETFTRSITNRLPINNMHTIRDLADRLYKKFNRKGKRVRLIGIGVSNLEDPVEMETIQLELFSDKENEMCDSSDKKIRIEKILDDLKEGFGEHVSRASLINSKKKEDIVK